MTEFMEEVNDLIIQNMESGELDLESTENLKSVLQEYSVQMKIIEKELEMCKRDHLVLRNQVAKVMEENQTLVDRLKGTRDRDVQEAEIQNQYSVALDNKNHQLTLALQEKHLLEEQWKLALNVADDLREKLSQCQSGKQLTILQTKLNNAEKDYSEAIQILEGKITQLKHENDRLIAKTTVLENQLERSSSQVDTINVKNQTLESALKEATKNEQDYKSRFLAIEASYIELEKKYQADKIKFANLYEFEKTEQSLRSRVEKAIRERDEIHAALERCHEQKAEMLRSEANTKAKIQEAVELVEAAMLEKAQALTEHAAATEKVQRLEFEMDRLVEEASLRASDEVASIKKHYENQLSELRNQLLIKEQESARKNVEVQQLQRECERLQKLMSTSSLPKITSSDKQLDQIYQELNYTETECQQLQFENQALREALDKLQDRNKRYSREKLRLKEEIKMADQHHQSCVSELAAMTQKADLLYSQLQQTSLELAVAQSEAAMFERGLSKSEARISVTDSLELFKQVDASYTQMNERWRNEMINLTDNFEAQLKKVKSKSRRKNHSSKDNTASKSNGTDSNR